MSYFVKHDTCYIIQCFMQTQIIVQQGEKVLSKCLSRISETN